MILADALYRGIAQRSPGTEGRSISAMVAEIERYVGGPHVTRDAAAAAGLSESTWRRLRTGRVRRPTPATVGRLLDAQRRARLSRGRERWMRTGGQIVVHALVQVSQDQRERRLLVTGWRSAPDRDALLDHWLRRDDSRAAGILLGAMRGEIPELRMVDVHAVRWFRTRGEALQWMRSS